MKAVFQGTLQGSWRRGDQRKNWLTNVKDWTGRPYHWLAGAPKSFKANQFDPLCCSTEEDGISQGEF